MTAYRDSARAIDLYSKAARLLWSSRLRRGNIVRLPRRGDCFVTGDLHGNWDNFSRMRDKADLAKNTKRHLVLQEVLHGGSMTEKGACLSFQLLEEAAKLIIEFRDRVHMVAANHDFAEVTDHRIMKLGKQLNSAFFDGLRYSYGDYAGEVRDYLRDFLLSIPLAVSTRTGVFICHSLPNADALPYFDVRIFKRRLTEEDMETYGSAFDMVWGRDLTEEIAQVFGRLVGAQWFLVGHTPCDNGFTIPNSRTIILDTKDENAVYLPLSLDRKMDLKRLRDLITTVFEYPERELP